MGRRKKKSKLNTILVVLALGAIAWVGADYYSNVWQKKPAQAPEPEPAGQVEVKESVPAPEKPIVAQESGFKTETYRDERFGFEFQYPVPVRDDPQCAKIIKTDDGFSLGIFSLYVTGGEGLLQDYINEQLAGMTVEKREAVALGGQPAVKIDYQTAGMGWYGSDTFVEHSGKFLDFGLLANEAANKCGGDEHYEDRVYQSVLSTLKFTD